MRACAAGWAPIALAVALGCEKPVAESPPPVSVPKPTAAAPFRPPPELKRLRISLTPHLEPESLERSHRPLSDYLARGLGVPVELFVASSYDELGASLRRGKIDLAEFSPFAYVRAQRLGTKMRPTVMVIADGSATSAGYVVVRSDSPYRQLEDLKGRSFGWVDRASTSGYLYPRKLMRDRGIDPDAFFGRTEFFGNHEAVLWAVLEGRVDAGSTYQGAILQLERSKGVDPLSFRIIAKTPRTPRDIFCVREDLPEPVVRRITELLLAISVRTKEGREVLRPMNINGFVPADDRLYEPVREVAAALDDGDGG